MENWEYECECGNNMEYVKNQVLENEDFVEFFCPTCGYGCYTPMLNPYIEKGE